VLKKMVRQKQFFTTETRRHGEKQNDSTDENGD
jgi:hypothetical protein